MRSGWQQRAVRLAVAVPLLMVLGGLLQLQQLLSAGMQLVLVIPLGIGAHLVARHQPSRARQGWR